MTDSLQRPEPPEGGCDRILASVIEWRRSPRALLAPQHSELWQPHELEHGYDALGRLVAERVIGVDGPTLLVDYRPAGPVAFMVERGFCDLTVMLEECRGGLRSTTLWRYADGVPETCRYIDGEFGIERAQTTQSHGFEMEFVYEWGADGRLERVSQVDAGGSMQLWPVPSRAAVAAALAEVASLAAPISAMVRGLAEESKAGLCVLSFSAEDSYLPPILSWLPTSDIEALRSEGIEMEDLWMTAEWPQTDLPYMTQEEAMRWFTLNTAVGQKPRAAEKALKGLARLVEADLRANGVQCVVAALPLEVEDRHERRVKKQVSPREWALLRSWGMVRRGFLGWLM